MVGELFGTKGLFLPQSMGDYLPGYMENHERRLLPVSVEKLKNIHQMNRGLISSFKEDKTKIQIRVAKVTFLH